MTKQTAVTVTTDGREAMRVLAVLATTATGRKLSMSDSVVGALTVIRAHPDEFRDALMNPVRIEAAREIAEYAEVQEETIAMELAAGQRKLGGSS